MSATSVAGSLASPNRWEQAYQAFESPEAEFRKFLHRLRSVGAEGWDRSLPVLEVCSGRGTGLRAWHALGYRRLTGVDFSPALIAAHRGPGNCVLGDARCLPIASRSQGVAVVQGGLHHLQTRDDVERVLAEMQRVVVPDGRIVIIEPWLTPFLRFVHLVCAQPLARRFSRKLDALAIMIEEERETYDRWLNAPDLYLQSLRRFVAPLMVRRAWGKLVIVGRPRHA